MEALLERIEDTNVEGLASGGTLGLIVESAEAVSEGDGEAEVFGEEGLGDVEAEDGAVGGVEFEDSAGVEGEVGAALVVGGLIGMDFDVEAGREGSEAGFDFAVEAEAATAPSGFYAGEGEKLVAVIDTEGGLKAGQVTKRAFERKAGSKVPDIASEGSGEDVAGTDVIGDGTGGHVDVKAGGLRLEAESNFLAGEQLSRSKRGKEQEGDPQRKGNAPAELPDQRVSLRQRGDALVLW
jgi:hypothetical protein